MQRLEISRSGPKPVRLALDPRAWSTITGPVQAVAELSQRILAHTRDVPHICKDIHLNWLSQRSHEVVDEENIPAHGAA
jgi:hypothetical protein